MVITADKNAAFGRFCMLFGRILLLQKRKMMYNRDKDQRKAERTSK